MDQNNDVLAHYGVLGMKWGVRKAQYKSSSNSSLHKKALKYDKKAADMTKKSEKTHAKDDLGGANKKAVKAAKYRKAAATTELKSLKADTDYKQSRLHEKAEKLNFKATKAEAEANRLSKTKGYSLKAMKYAIKSDKAAIKAARVRKKIAANDYYIQRMKRKASTINKEDLMTKYAFVRELDKL